MDIVRIVGVGLITCVAVLLVRQVKPDVAALIGLAGGIIIVFMIVDSVSSIFDGIRSVIEKTGVSSSLFSLVLKIVGVGYLTEFAGNICSDCGQSSLADKILLGGKVIILAMSMPIITNIIEIIVGLLP